MTSWVFDLPLNPVPLERPRVTHAGDRARAYMPAASTAFVDAFRWAIRTVRPRPLEPLDMPLALTIRLWRNTKNGQRGDLDNIVKAIGDAGNGQLWVDDRQIVECHAMLVDSGPAVRGRIWMRMHATSDTVDQEHTTRFIETIGRLAALARPTPDLPALQAHLDQVGTSVTQWLGLAGVEYSDPLVQRAVLRLLDGLVVTGTLAGDEAVNLTALRGMAAGAYIAATLDVVPA